MKRKDQSTNNTQHIRTQTTLGETESCELNRGEKRSGKYDRGEGGPQGRLRRTKKPAKKTKKNVTRVVRCYCFG
jgi:hypothetical protein